MCSRGLLMLFLLLSVSALSQDVPGTDSLYPAARQLRPEDTTERVRFRSLGIKHGGIGWGHRNVPYSGFMLNLISREEKVNGINLMAVSDERHNTRSRTNGLDLSLLFSCTHTVNGLALTSIWGSHDRVRGIDIALIGNGLDGTLRGVSIGGLISSAADVCGISLSGLCTVNVNLKGIAFGGLYCNEDKLVGLSMSLLVNKSDDLQGMALAPFNFCEYLQGVQVGLFNKAVTGTGVQFGLINCIDRNPPPFRIMPFVNFSIRTQEQQHDTIRVQDSLIDHYEVRTRYPNGQVEQTEVFLGDKLHGDCEYFDRHGRITRRLHYEKGRKKGWQLYYDHQERIKEIDFTTGEYAPFGDGEVYEDVLTYRKSYIYHHTRKELDYKRVDEYVKTRDGDTILHIDEGKLVGKHELDDLRGRIRYVEFEGEQWNVERITIYRGPEMKALIPGNGYWTFHKQDTVG
ncbi:MAG TPA: hypothetical protein VNZ86_10000, partial [Bacteroidia bacterium]|nr:hypothetical protein [Bacteroidia bacterium]